MSFIVGICRLVLPLISVIILFKCFLTLLIGHPINKTYGYIVNRATGEKIALNTWETSIGRSKSCDINIEYGSVSRFHAVICRRVDGWYIFDTISKTGTYVNGTKIEKGTTINNADEIAFGDVSFYFVITDDPVIKVGRKKRKNKKNIQNENNTVDTNNADSIKETQNTPTDEKIDNESQSENPEDDFGEIHIDFHPNKQNDNIRFDGEIKDIYSDSAPKETNNPSIVQNNEVKRDKQAALIKENGGTYILCADNITIGRSRNNDIRLNAPTVSRSHVSLSKTNGKWYATDLNSTHGTFVNGNKITSSYQLNSGDILSLCEENLRFEEDYNR